ncbi:MAG: HEAT repeat domain-containing protein [Anaerolineae bacterium]|nr:HEAT repeat domain-containing protein [Anaerolineae bacterium]
MKRCRRAPCGRWGTAPIATGTRRCDALDSHSHVKRLAAVYAAGELEIQAAAPRLIILLDDPDPAMRRAAVTALGTVGGPLALRRCKPSSVRRTMTWSCWRPMPWKRSISTA